MAQLFVEVAPTLLSIGAIIQQKQLFDQEHQRAQDRHLDALRKAKFQHQVSLRTTKETYLLELFHNLEQHFQQLNADLIASTRESERDMFDQRNQAFQTIILSSSVMFSALSTVIVQGYLDSNTNHIYAACYAASSAISFACLSLNA